MGGKEDASEEGKAYEIVMSIIEIKTTPEGRIIEPRVIGPEGKPDVRRSAPRSWQTLPTGWNWENRGRDAAT